MKKVIVLTLLLLGLFVLEHFLKLLLLFGSFYIFDSCSIQLSNQMVISSWLAEMVSPPAALLVGYISGLKIRNFWLAFVPVGIYFLASMVDLSFHINACGESPSLYSSVIGNFLGPLIAYPGMTVGWKYAEQKKERNLRT